MATKCEPEKHAYRFEVKDGEVSGVPDGAKCLCGKYSVPLDLEPEPTTIASFPLGPAPSVIDEMVDIIKRLKMYVENLHSTCGPACAVSEAEALLGRLSGQEVGAPTDTPEHKVCLPCQARGKNCLVDNLPSD